MNVIALSMVGVLNSRIFNTQSNLSYEGLIDIDQLPDGNFKNQILSAVKEELWKVNNCTIVSYKDIPSNLDQFCIKEYPVTINAKVNVYIGTVYS